MSILKTLILGRPDGVRSRLVSLVKGAVTTLRSAICPRPGAGRSQNGSRGPPGCNAAPSTIPGQGPDTTIPRGYRVVLERSALRPGQTREIFLDGRSLLLADVDGKVHALSNTCLHANGPLAEGTLEGHTISCPHHGWTYDLRDGACKVDTRLSLETFQVEVMDGRICLKMNSSPRAEVGERSGEPG